MQKEILTRAIIEKELRRFCPKNLLVGILILPFLALVCYIIVFYLILFLNLLVRDKVTLNIIAGVIFAFFAFEYFRALMGDIKLIFAIRKGNYQISTDWVVNKLPAVISRYRSRPDTLVFARGGEYYIPSNNYKWSKLYAMNDLSVFNSTKINDEFYVVSAGKYKNILAYNKRMFDFKDEGI